MFLPEELYLRNTYFIDFSVINFKNFDRLKKLIIQHKNIYKFAEKALLKTLKLLVLNYAKFELLA